MTCYTAFGKWLSCDIISLTPAENLTHCFPYKLFHEHGMCSKLSVAEGPPPHSLIWDTKEPTRWKSFTLFPYLCSCSVFCAPRSMFRASCFVLHAPCFQLHARCPVPRLPCPVSRAPCPLSRVPCLVSCVSCPVSSVPCLVSRVLCLVSRGPCPVVRPC